MTRLILLDRDGVINVESEEYVKDADEWIPIAGALAGIAQLKRSGYLVAVCSNQAGIGRGILTEAGLARIHQKFATLLSAEGASLDGLNYCPHHPDEGCPCRKPNPGLLTEMMGRLGVPPQETVYVGDRLKDVQAALAAGCTPILVRTGHGRQTEAAARGLGVTCVADDLAALAEALSGRAPC